MQAGICVEAQAAGKKFAHQRTQQQQQHRSESAAGAQKMLWGINQLFGI
jgi:hypothetical protein